GPPPEMALAHSVDAAEIYRVYFHGPAYQVLRRAWWDDGRIVGEFAADLPVNHHPAGLPLAIEPRWIELCFQTAGLWEMATQHRMGLPQSVEAVWLGRGYESANGPLYAVVTPGATGDSFDADVVDAGGNCYLHLAGYRTVAFREEIDAAWLH